MRRFAAIGAALAAFCAIAPATAAAEAPPVVRASHEASERYGVPADLLLAIGYTSTHWRMRASDDGGRVPHAWGPMHLVARGRGLRVGAAARATGLSEAALRRDVRANVLAGAALLARGGVPRTYAGWHERLRTVAGRLWADEVFRVLASGARARVGGRLVVLRAHPRVAGLVALTNDYGAAVWRPSPNYSNAARTYYGAVDRVVIHTTEGSFAGSVQWLRNSAADASAHYVVGRYGQIAQLVAERKIAWHAGNWDVNQRSIGVEHEGYTWSRGWYTTTEYRRSARLVAQICVRYGIPIDRQHIIGHNEVPDPNHPGQWGGISHHRDPGPYWNWTYYMSLVRSYAAQATVPPLPAPGVANSGFADGDTLSGTTPWSAVPANIRASEIQRISFWIDGSRRHIEYYAPYAFRSDGFIDTTDLADGPHKLQVRLVTRIGKVVRGTAWVTTANHAPPVACIDGEFAAAYYSDVDGRHLTGAPVATGCESAPLAYDWGAGGPAGTATDGFSARWVGRFDFDAATYLFTVAGDDGVRLYVDGVRVVDEWHDQPGTSHTANVAVEAGTHTVELEYFEHSGAASVALDWTPTA